MFKLIFFPFTILSLILKLTSTIAMLILIAIVTVIGYGGYRVAQYLGYV